LESVLQANKNEHLRDVASAVINQLVALKSLSVSIGTIGSVSKEAFTNGEVVDSLLDKIFEHLRSESSILKTINICTSDDSVLKAFDNSIHLRLGNSIKISDLQIQNRKESLKAANAANAASTLTNHVE
jgi:hypothetical protein